MEMMLNIKTNNQARDLMCWFDLTPKEQSQFDWIEKPEDCAESFFRYRNWVYCLSDMMRAPDSLPNWHAHQSDSFFSGIVIRIVNDGESVICGTYNT